jgi:hypothetical protein
VISNDSRENDRMNFKPSSSNLFLILLLPLAACGQFGGQGILPASENAPVSSDDQQLSSDDEQSTANEGNPMPDYADASTSSDPTAALAITNINELAASTGVAAYLQAGYQGQGIKVAILDNGFAGLKNSLESGRLPINTTYIPGRDGSSSADTAHGTKLAELVHGLAPKAKVYLINSNGYSNFVRAIDQAIQAKVDMILYAQVWEYGGNFDGGGFINSEVNKAVRSGILWVNAAGNYGLATWEGQLQGFQGNRAVVSPALGNEKIRFHLPSGSNTKIVLTWDDFRNQKDYRTGEDFDLVVEDASGRREVAASRLIQDGQDHGLDEKYSGHAREFIRTQLPQGTWFLRIEAKNPQAIKRPVKFRLSVDGFGAQIIDARSFNSIMIPADNPAVLAAGAWDTTLSGTGAGILEEKPDFLAPSRLVFSDGQSILGSSSAAGVATGALAAWQSRFGRLGTVENWRAAGFGRRFYLPAPW